MQRLVLLTGIPIGVIALGGLLILLSPADTTHWFVLNERFIRQIAYLLIAVVLIYVCAHVAPTHYRNRSLVLGLYGVTLFLLIAVLFFGSSIKGARAWFDVGFFSFQPADFGKIGLILILSLYYSKRHMLIGNLRYVVGSLMYVVVPVGLILMQPDLGSALVYLAIWFGIVVSAGLPARYIGVLVGGVIAVSVVSWFFLFAEYQKDRIRAFMDPSTDPYGSGYNVTQALIAVGSGQVWGKGFGQGTQSRLGYLPEYHTDFIFASFVEEWGMIGALVIITASGVFVTAIFLSARSAPSNVEALYAVGFGWMIMTHVVINVGMNVGLVPVTGLPMPFMSFGGSHIASEAIGLGIWYALMRRQVKSRTTGDVEYFGPSQFA